MSRRSTPWINTSPYQSGELCRLGLGMFGRRIVHPPNGLVDRSDPDLVAPEIHLELVDITPLAGAHVKSY